MIVYLICYMVSYFLALRGYYYLSGLALLVAAVWLYISDYRRSGNLIHLRGLFSLFWVGGQGLSCMKLSYLQVDWAGMTWFCLALAYAGFWLVFEVLSRLYGTGYDSHSRFRSFSGNARPVFHMIFMLTMASLSAFIMEAVILGYIPLFLRGVPHAYS